MKVDGTIYEIRELPDRRWVITLDGVQIGRPCRTKGEALSGAITRQAAVLVGGGAEKSAA